MNSWGDLEEAGGGLPAQVDIQRLEYLRCIAEHGSVTRAAAELGTAQPALSRQLRHLEADLGTTLLVRTARGVHLTPAGEKLCARAAAPLRHLDLTMRWIGTSWGRPERSVRLGIAAAIAPALAVPVLATVRTALPWLQMSIHVADTPELHGRLCQETLTSPSWTVHRQTATRPAARLPCSRGCWPVLRIRICTPTARCRSPRSRSAHWHCGPALAAHR